MNRLQVRGLGTIFDTDEGPVRSVADVSFDIRAGKTTAIVGESGSGKSVTSLTLMRLLPRGAATRVSGQALFVDRAGETVDLLTLPEPRMRAIRGNEVAMIFQEPMTSLNPVFTVGEQIAEPLMRHRAMPRRAALERAAELLDTVGIPMARARLASYPHELSGGMRQRVMIAMALACQPRLLICDEPTTALDVTVQAQILELLARLQQEFGTAIMLITHDLGVVAEFARRAIVMYAGRIVEQAESKLDPKDVADRVIDRRHCHLFLLDQVLAVLVVVSADHFHIGPGVQRVHSRISLGTRKAVEHQLHHRRVIADDQAVELPFVAKDLLQNEWIRGCWNTVKIVERRHERSDASIDRRLERWEVIFAQRTLGKIGRAVIATRFRGSVADPMLGCRQDLVLRAVIQTLKSAYASGGDL